MPTIAVTGQQAINSALTILGILEAGGTPSASESTDSLFELNSMWNAWGIDEGLIFALQQITQSLAANTASMSIGTGATWNTPVPSRIYDAYIVNAGNRNKIDVVNAERYFSHRDLGAAAATPDEVYLDFNVSPTTGFATVYTWPVQTGTPTLELTVGTTFIAWTLAGTVYLEQGFMDAISYALAWRLIPRFGLIVPQQIAQEIAMNGEKAELRIREMNKVNRQLPPGTEMLTPPPQPGAPQAR